MLAEAINLHAWSELETLTGRQCAPCHLAHKMSSTPTKMVEEDCQPLRDLGFDDEMCLEVGHIVGSFNYLTRLADGFGLVLDPETKNHAPTEEDFHAAAGS